jgi:two-component system LytT family response regulator
MTIRALIADDEPLAREGIRALLAGEPDVVIVAECADGADAVARITDLRPDLLFLDIQMPELNGFEVMRAIGVDTVPAVIFVTAYDQYALEAFHVHAVDYLLKPANEERFAVAMRRARSLLEYEEGRLARGRIASMLTAVEHAPPRLARLVVRAGRCCSSPTRSTTSRQTGITRGCTCVSERSSFANRSRISSGNSIRHASFVCTDRPS